MTDNLPATEQDLKKQGNSLIQTANNLCIKTVEDKKYAVALTQDINAFIKDIKAFFKPMKDKQTEALQVTRDTEKKTLAIPEEAKNITLGKITSFDQEEEQRRLAEEARLREEARKKHEVEIKKANAKIDKLLEKTKDTQETIDLIKMELENHTHSDVEHQELLIRLEIEEARLAGDQEKIEEFTEMMGDEPLLVLVSRPEKVAGSVARVDVEVEIINEIAVVRSIAEGVLPISCCKFSIPEIKKVIKMHGGKRNFPGIKYRMVKKTHVRG